MNVHNLFFVAVRIKVIDGHRVTQGIIIAMLSFNYTHALLVDEYAIGYSLSLLFSSRLLSFILFCIILKVERIHW